MGNGYLNLLLLLFVIYEWEFYLEQRGREFSAQCNQTSSVAIKQLSTLYWLGCLNFRPKTLYKDPDDGRQRFLLELDLQSDAVSGLDNSLFEMVYFLVVADADAEI